MTVEQIEAMELKEMNFVGRYRFKKVEIVSPIQNVANLTYIEGNYYRKVPDDRDSLAAVRPPETAYRRKDSMLNTYADALFGKLYNPFK